LTRGIGRRCDGGTRDGDPGGGDGDSGGGDGVPTLLRISIALGRVALGGVALSGVALGRVARLSGVAAIGHGLSISSLRWVPSSVGISRLTVGVRIVHFLL